MKPSSRILLVDDQADNLFVLERVILRFMPSAEIVSARSAEEGLDLAEQHTFNTAVIDVQMPDIDGIEMCRRLKSDSRSRFVPIILITSHGAPAAIRAEGLEAGADDFISRPVDNEELAARIRVALRVNRMETELMQAKNRAEAMNEFLRETLTCSDEINLAELFLDISERVSGADIGFVGEINEVDRLDALALDMTAWDRCSMPDAENLLRNMEIRGLWSRVLTEERPIISDNPAHEPSSIGVPEGHPKLSSFLGVPLQVRGRSIGLVALANADGGFSKTDAESVEGLTTCFVEALMRLRAEKRVSETTKDREKALDLMAGRELRMAQLKSKMRRLDEENQQLRLRLERDTSA